jgi:NAD+ kinase
VGRGAENAVLNIDGQETIPLSAQHRVIIRKAPVCFGLVKVPGRSFYQTLRDKLRWAAQPHFRVEP